MRSRRKSRDTFLSNDAASFVQRKKRKEFSSRLLTMGLFTRCWDYDYYRHDVDDGTMTTGDDYSLHVGLRLLAVTIR